MFIVKSRVAFCPDVINGDLLGKEIVVIPAALNMLRLVMVLTRFECKVGGRRDMDINVFSKGRFRPSTGNHIRPAGARTGGA